MGSIFMSKRSRYSAEEKLMILRLRDEGVKSKSEVLSEYGVHDRTLRDWRYRFTTYGFEGLLVSNALKKHSKELKLEVLNAVLTGSITQRAAMRKYEIPGSGTISSWIKQYTGNRALKSTPKGLVHSMTKGRSTTWRERIEIVLYCLTHDHDYGRTAEVHQVSYQQVYQWVRKYNSGGEDALKDNRGRTKILDELTSEEKTKLEYKKLQAENERLRAENAFLKKLEEFERRRS